MKPDRELLEEALDTFKKLRHWVDPDYYREHVMPTINKLKNHLAFVETKQWQQDRKNAYAKHNPGPDELRTVPSRLIESATNFGVFNSAVLRPSCKKHPDAPHGKIEELSSALDRYVCRCEFWEETK